MKLILLVLMIEEIMWREMWCFCRLSVISVETVRLKFTTLSVLICRTDDDIDRLIYVQIKWNVTGLMMMQH